MKFSKIALVVAIQAVVGALAVIASDTVLPKEYPLRKCPVSDERLGEHGKPFKATAPDGTDVYLCCKDCLKDFTKDPAKYAKLVKDAVVK